MDTGFRVQLAQAWIPFQVYNTRWDPMEGLMKGTIFPDLYRPYEPGDRR